MPDLMIRLLGPPVIHCDGDPMRVDTRKAVALLAYLAVSGHSHTREGLAALLWPEYDHTRSRSALRRTLSVLRKALDGRWLHVDRDTIDLPESDGLWVDVQEFKAKLQAGTRHRHSRDGACRRCVATLSEAADLYRGDFLAGFTLRDTEVFDEWQLIQGEELRRELTMVLRRLVDEHTALGEYEPAIRWARRWLDVDPLHEPAHQRLMELYAMAGERTHAIEQYRRCVALLDRELGVAPLAETTDLYHAVKEEPSLHTPARPTQDEVEHLVPKASPRRHPYPLVGRDAEVGTLLNALRSADGNGRLLLIEGEAGIGKTRLAEEVAAAAESLEKRVLWARGYEGESEVAFGVLAELLRSGAETPGSDERLDGLPPDVLVEATRLAPSLRKLVPNLPAPVALDGPAAQARLLESNRVVLSALCGDNGVLVVDDLQWADTASLESLAYIVRRFPTSGPSLLVTRRSDDVGKDDDWRGLVTDATRVGTLTSVRLSRLDQEDVGLLVVSAAQQGADIGADFSDTLFEETEGVPLFIVEYLGAMVSKEAASDDSLPRSVRDLLLSKLSSVGEIGGQVAAAAAVIGRTSEFDTLREVSGRGDEELVAAIEELISHGVIAESTAGEGTFRVDFTHSKLRDLAYEETSLARRRLLHRRAAAVHERRAVGAPGATGYVQIAHHYQLGGEEAAAADHYRRAGEEARSLYANADALDYFASALALGHPDEAALHVDIGDLHMLLGDFRAALADYEVAAALGDGDIGPTAEHRLGLLLHRIGEWDHAERYFRAARDAFGVEKQAAQASRVVADWALTEQRRGSSERALELGDEALRLAVEAADPLSRARAHNILGILASDSGDVEAARRHLADSLAISDELADQSVRVAALNNLARVTARAGDSREGRRLAEQALELCRTIGDRHREAAVHNNLADLLYAAGHMDESMSHLKEAVRGFAEIGSDTEGLQPEIWKLEEW